MFVPAVYLQSGKQIKHKARISHAKPFLELKKYFFFAFKTLSITI